MNASTIAVDLAKAVSENPISVSIRCISKSLGRSSQIKTPAGLPPISPSEKAAFSDRIDVWPLIRQCRERVFAA